MSPTLVGENFCIILFTSSWSENAHRPIGFSSRLCVCVSVSSGPCDGVKWKSSSLSAPREDERTPSQSGPRTPRENVQMTPGTCFLRQRLKRKQTPEREGRGILPLGLHDVKRGLCSSSLRRTDTLRARKQERCFPSGEQSFIVVLILFRRK